MKKLLLIAIALSTSLGLVACGNEDNSPKKPKQDVKTEQQKTKKSKSSTKKDHKVTDKNNSSQEETPTFKQNTSTSTEPTTKKTTANTTTTSDTSEQTATPATQSVRSQKDETNGRGNIVNSASQAITTLSNGLGNNSDFAYTLLSTENHMYEIQVTSKSIKAQGGSGTIGIYDVMEDGTYFLRP